MSETRRLAAIMFVDMVGFSSLVSSNEEEGLEAIRRAREMRIRPAAQKHGGQIVKWMGDGALILFSSLTEAMRAALSIQSHEDQTTFRVGLHAGEVLLDGEDVMGDDVNVAARLEAMALPGGICVSDRAQSQIKGQHGDVLTNCGERQLKNISNPMVVWHWPGVLPAPEVARAAANRTGMPRLLVTLFSTRSRDEDDRFLAEGITEDLIARLARSRSLAVLSRYATYAPGDENALDQALASKADFLIEGDVRRSGQRVRVTAKLTDMSDTKLIWSEQYDCIEEDVFDFQDRSAVAIAKAIEPELLEAERNHISRREAKDLSTWQLGQAGLGILWKYNKEDYPRAIELFRRASEADASASVPYAGEAYALVHAYKEGVIADGAEVLDRALSLARKATRQDPGEPFAFVALGRTHIARKEYHEALAAYTIALSIDPNSDTAHMGMGYALCMLGRADEALEYLDMGANLMPFAGRNPTIMTLRSFALTMIGDYDKALRTARVACELPEASHWAHVAEAMACAGAGLSSEAEAALRIAQEKKPGLDEDALMAAYPFSDSAGAKALAASLMSRTNIFRTRVEAVDEHHQ
jgi:adenylate cyclase